MTTERPRGSGEASPSSDDEVCPVCGAAQLHEIRCKIVCLNCRTIVKSCADL